MSDIDQGTVNQSPENAAQDQVLEQQVTMSQRELNDLLAAKHRSALEKGEQLALAKMKSQQPAQAQQNTGLSKEEASRLFAEQLEQARNMEAQQLAAHNLLRNFEAKLEAAKEEYPDLAQQLDAIGIDQMPELVIATVGLPNTADVLADLVENTHKIQPVISSFKEGKQKLALASIHKLSQSIEKNKAAVKNATTPAEPIEDIQPSLTGGDDVRTSAISKLRDQPWLRG